MSTTYRAIEVKKPGDANHFWTPALIRYAFASRRVASATRTRPRSKGYFRLIGLACRAMKSSGGSMPLVLVSRAGRLVSAWVSGFLAALVDIASSAAVAI